MKSMRFSIVVVAAALAFVNTAAAQPAGVKVLKDLPYVENGHQRNKLDLYLPEKVKGPLPVIVWIHGGAWSAGSKDGCPAVWLTGKGYAVASINYRLSQHAVFPAQIEDCKAAIRWLRAIAGKYHFDPDHIGVWGASAGGHLVALLGTAGGAKELEGKGGNADQSSRVQCVVDWFGPTDLVSIDGQGNKADTPVAKLIGGPVQDNREKAKKASPLFYVSKDSVPFLIMHGDKDKTVPLKQSEVLVDALAKAGVEVKLQIINDNGHGGPGFNTPESKKLIEEFFDKHLKGKEPGKSDAKTGAAPAKPRVLVTISKETTYITAPLRKDGYPDYIAALNERFRKGVTPKDNSAIPFWKAFGPECLAIEELPQYYEMLNMPPLPQRGNYFISTDTWVREHPERERDFSKGLDKTIQRPWSKVEYPEISKWLKANEAPLNLLIQASKRPTRYDPILSGDPRGGSLEDLHMCAELMSNNAAWALVQRCMMRTQEGKIDEAWEDLLTCHRLGRLIDKGPFLVDTRIESQISSLAFVADKAMFRSDAINAKKLSRMQAEFAKVHPVYDLADKINFYGRCMFLDSFCQCARTQFFSMGQLFNHEYTRGREIEDELDAEAQKSLDYDVIFKVGNSWFDRIVSAGKQPSRRERLRDIDAIEKEIEARAKDARDALSWHLEVYHGDARREVSKRMAVFYIRRFLHDLRITLSDEDQTNARFDLTSSAFALAAYRADHGAYPEKLTELSPKYIAKVPGDVFVDDAPLHYKQQGAGYLLYSVGPNGKDDGGRGYPEYDEGKPCDDISIRVP